MKYLKFYYVCLIAIIAFTSCSRGQQNEEKSRNSVVITGINNGAKFDAGDEIKANVEFHSSTGLASYKIIIYSDVENSWKKEISDKLSSNTDSFEVVIKIPKDTKAGKYKLTASISDKNNNECFESLDIEILDIEGYDENGLDRTGYNRSGYDINGFGKDGYNGNGLDKDGYNRDGFNKDGYDRKGYDREGFNKDGYNKENYDRKGLNTKGWDREGYDIDGFDKDGYDRKGFDREGYNRKGFDRDGYNKEWKEKIRGNS